MSASIEALSLGLAGVAFAAGFAAAWTLKRRKDEKRERFFSFIAHELNTQVTGLSLTAENLLAGVFGALSEEHRRWMLAVDHRVDLLGCMIGDLRDVAHWEFGGTVRLQVEPVALKPIVEREAGLLAPTAARTKVQLEVKIADGLPPAKADAYRLKRVVSSLLHNALKFTVPGGAVTFAAAEANGRLRAELRYTVDGEPPDPGQVFDMYFSVADPHVHTLRTVGVGYGVGRRAVEDMGGEMGLVVGKDNLVTYFFTLPVAQPAKEAAHPAPQTTAPPPAA